MHRRIETILVLGMVVGAGSGALIGFLYVVWVSLTSGSPAGSGDWTGLAAVFGAAVGVAVALPTGVVWIVLARPEPDVLVGARWAAAFTAALSVLAVALVLLGAVGGLAVVCSVAAGLVAHLCGPRLGVWRSAP